MWSKYSQSSIVPSLFTFVLKQDIVASQSSQSLCDHYCVLNTFAWIVVCVLLCFLLFSTDRPSCSYYFALCKKKTTPKLTFAPRPFFFFFFSLQVEQVKLLDRFSTSNKSLTGTLYLTATHLLFIDSSQRETWVRIMNACTSEAEVLQLHLCFLI